MWGQGIHKQLRSVPALKELTIVAVVGGGGGGEEEEGGEGLEKERVYEREGKREEGQRERGRK